MADAENKKEETPEEQQPAGAPEAYDGMSSLGRSFLEKNESSRGDLRALRNMHRRRTKTGLRRSSAL